MVENKKHDEKVGEYRGLCVGLKPRQFVLTTTRHLSQRPLVHRYSVLRASGRFSAIRVSDVDGHLQVDPEWPMSISGTRERGRH